MRLSGARTKREAIVQAIQEYNRRKHVSELVKFFGTFKSIQPNDELEAEQLDHQERRLRDPD
jgi:hypothetical protein